MKSSRSAWLALLSSIITCPLAVWVGLANQQNKWFPNMLSILLVMVPPVTSVVLGLRPAKSGNRLAAHVTAIGSAWATLVIAFFVGANYLWSGESLILPDLLSILLAILVGVSVEGAWNRSRWSSGGVSAGPRL